MSLTIASVNVNGIRAATKIRNEDNPGMLAWLTETSADVVLMQEVRATVDQARAALSPALETGWHLAVAPAEGLERMLIDAKLRRRHRIVRDLAVLEFPDEGVAVDGDLVGAGAVDHKRAGSPEGFHGLRNSWSQPRICNTHYLKFRPCGTQQWAHRIK